LLPIPEWVAASTYPANKHATHPTSASQVMIHYTKKEEKKKKGQESKPEGEGIHQHAVSARKTHHGYWYRTLSGFYRKNERETAEAEAVAALSPRHSHFASSPQHQKKL